MMGQGDLREFLDRFAKHLDLVVFPRSRELRIDEDLLWRIADPKSPSRVLFFESWGFWEFASLEMMAEAVLASRYFWLGTSRWDSGRREDIQNPLRGKSLEEARVLEDLWGW